MAEAIPAIPAAAPLIPAALLELLRCPVTGQRLALAPEPVIRAVEARRKAGALRLQAPEPQIDLTVPIEEGLLREDGRVFYAIHRGIPVLLPDHEIDVEPSQAGGGATR